MQFKERLKERMKQKNIDTKEFAKRLYNYGSDSDLWESYEKKSSDIRKVEKWKKGTNEPKNIDELRKICDILDCDFSYLLGDNPIANLNNKKVAEYLGLDEIVISRIKSYDNSLKMFMQVLVRGDEQEEELGDILYQTLSILNEHSCNSSNKTITIKDDITEESITLDKEQSINYVMAATENAMQTVLYKVSIIGINIGRIASHNKFNADMHQMKENTEKMLNEITKLTGKSREEIFEDIEKHKKQ